MHGIKIKSSKQWRKPMIYYGKNNNLTYTNHQIALNIYSYITDVKYLIKPLKHTAECRILKLIPKK